MAQAVKSIFTTLFDWYLSVSRFVLRIFTGFFSMLKFLAGWALKLLIPIVLLYLVYSVYLERNDFNKYKASDRGAAGIVGDPIDPDVAPDRIKYLEQNWTVNDSNWFYFATQGSNLIPYDFFLFLEQKDNENLFRSPDNMNAFRYLPQTANKGNPDALPVGMTKDTYLKKSYMGFTCAACHTSQINHVRDDGVNTGIRIDGGPAASDMEKFMEALADSLDATRKNKDKLSRFKEALKNHAGGDYEGEDKEQELLDDLDYFAIQLRTYVEVNSPVDDLFAVKYPSSANGNNKRSHYGFARLDAFGRIFNRGIQHVVDPKAFRKQLESKLPQPVIDAIKQDLDEIYGDGSQAAYPTPTRAVVKTMVVLDAKTPSGFGEEVYGALRELRSEIYNAADAAASYPYLWDVPQHDYIQWTGLVSNAGLGPLGRNTGQVIGVFGTLDWEKRNEFPYRSITEILNLLKGGGLGSHYVSYKSSIDKANLRRVEYKLRDLWSPEWPEEIMGEINQDLLPVGRELFVKHCQECHHDIKRTDPERRIIAHISSVESAGTDPLLAENAVNATGSAGILSGMLSGDALGEIILTEKSPVPAILKTATKGVIATTDPDKGPIRAATEWAFDLLRTVKNNDVKPTRRIGDYDLATPQKPYAPITGYKARPLNGIWATAPYMHNGSIPNLYEVLLPKQKQGIAANEHTEFRSDSFMVGSRQFDVDNVGFKSADYPTGEGFLFDTSLRGNSNAGHDYGTDELSVDDRRALLEYLKQL